MALLWRADLDVRGLGSAQLLDADDRMRHDGGAGGWEPKYLHWLDVMLGGELARVYVGHMIASQHLGGPRKARYRTQMSGQATLISGHPGPAVLLEDLNLVPDNSLSQPLRDAGMVSVWDSTDPDPPTHGNRTIDDVMHRGLELVGQPVVVPMPSDHHAVLAELRRAA